MYYYNKQKATEEERLSSFPSHQILPPMSYLPIQAQRTLTIDGITTEIVTQTFSDRHVVIVTQSKKLGYSH